MQPLELFTWDKTTFPAGWVAGWVAGSIGTNANSASVVVEVEVEAEAEVGNNKNLWTCKITGPENFLVTEIIGSQWLVSPRKKSKILGHEKL